MIQFSLTDFLSSETKQWLFDELIDATVQVGKKFLGDEIASAIENLKSDGAFNIAFRTALKNASDRWITEFEDQEIIIAITAEKQIWKNPIVTKTLRDIVRKPSGYHLDEINRIVDEFNNVAPGFDAARIREAIEFLLKCLAQEVISIPQLQPIFALQYQKISTEIAQQQLRELRLIRSDFRDTFISLTEYPYKQIAEVTQKSNKGSKKLYSNLPTPERNNLIGRDSEIKILYEHLKPYPESWLGVITIDGVGGVGKSALALEMAHTFVREYDALPERERFDAVIWTSAKHFIPTSSGVLRRSGYSRNLSDIFTEIATTLERSDITKASGETQVNLVRNILASQRTLLIIDNLETIDDELVVSFIRELPPPTKVIVTTRHRLDVAYPIRLTGINEDDARRLIVEEANSKNVNLTDEQIQRIVTFTGGLPLAIVLTLGRMSLGYEIDSALNWLSHPKGDIAKYCFEGSVQKIKGTHTYDILMSICIFPSGARRKIIGYIANIENKILRDDCLAQLTQLSLVNKRGDHFEMLPLTQKYAFSDVIDSGIQGKLLLRAGMYYFSEYETFITSPRWKSYDEIELERDNILYVLDYLADYTNVHSNHLEVRSLIINLTEIMAPYLLARGYWNDYKRVCNYAIDTSRYIEDAPNFVRFSHYLSRYYWHIRDLEQTSKWAQLGYKEAQKTENKDVIANAQHMLGILAIGNGKFSDAQSILEEALSNRTELYGCMGVCAIREDLGFAMMEQGDLAAAESLLEASYQLQLESDDREGQAIDLYYLGIIAERAEKIDYAIKMLYESMVLAETVKRSTTTANCQFGLARLLEKKGEVDEAREMARLARMRYERLGMQAQAQATAQIIARI